MTTASGPRAVGRVVGSGKSDGSVHSELPLSISQSSSTCSAALAIRAAPNSAADRRSQNSIIFTRAAQKTKAVLSISWPGSCELVAAVAALLRGTSGISVGFSLGFRTAIVRRRWLKDLGPRWTRDCKKAAEFE